MRSSSASKIKQIQDLMKSLQVIAQPKEIITKDGFIELTIIYTDLEQYPKESVVPLPIEAKEPEQKDVEAPVL